MICTLILPSSIIYAVGYTYTAIVDEGGMSTITIVLYGVLIGAQMLIFLARSRFDYLLWFFIYIVLGIPVFYFILPIYSFWHMDDFSWGTTRQVSPGKDKTAAAAAAAPPPKQEKPQPPMVLPVVQEQRESRRPPTIEEDHNGKLKAMGAGQLHASPRPRSSWEDEGATGSSNKSRHDVELGRRPTEARRSAGPVDLDEDSVFGSPTPVKKKFEPDFGNFDMFGEKDRDNLFDDANDLSDGDLSGPGQVRI